MGGWRPEICSGNIARTSRQPGEEYGANVDLIAGLAAFARGREENEPHPQRLIIDIMLQMVAAVGAAGVRFPLRDNEDPVLDRGPFDYLPLSRPAVQVRSDQEAFVPSDYGPPSGPGFRHRAFSLPGLISAGANR